MITVIVKRSAGNESVGSMWHETVLFDESATLGFVIARVKEVTSNAYEDIIIPAKMHQVESVPTPREG